MSEKMAKAMANILGIDHSAIKTIEHEPKELVPVEEPVEEKKEELSDDAQEDYTLARRTFKNLIKTGNDALDELGDLARNLEHPRAYEVLATMIKTVSDATKDLYDLQKKTKELKGVDKINENPPVNIDKAVFVGTTAELLQKIKNKDTNNG
jgi:Terminase DNA packaging enzyme